MPDHVPSAPGYYAFDPTAGWIRFEYLADMLLFRSMSDPPCECRTVDNPITETVI